MSGAIPRLLSAWLISAAAGRMCRTRADWADAMLAEAALCTSDRDRLGWAWGCWVASLRVSCNGALLVYVAGLLTGLAAMGAYEWSTDESRGTVIVLALIAALLGALRPRRALFSGVLVGLMVTCVLGFEAVSGIRPAYEARAQTLLQSLHWMILLIPALPAASVGARLRRRLASGRMVP